MTIIPFQELVDFIQSQPDDKEINMDESTTTDKCGCILVQFARAKHITRRGGVGFSHMPDHWVNGDCEKLIRKAFNVKITTFRQAKELLTSLPS